MPQSPCRSSKSGREPIRQLPAQVDLPAVEREVLRRWGDRDVFARTLRRTSSGPRWVFYEGPPTANGLPGVHHVEARALKDVFPRFKTMKGYHVDRPAGWDCHGLPVEVAIERELGLSGRRDIERYGVAQFNARCRESVSRHISAFTDMTERMGYWVDTSRAYRTMDPAYVEAVWWSLKVIFDAGLLVREHRISPYCPRCETVLSDHELGQPGGHQTVIDPAVTVRLPIASGPMAGKVDLLVWTTTPWTLVANTAVAVHPDVTYVVARRAGHGDRVIVAEARLGRTLGEGWHAIRRLPGAELAGLRYEPPLDLVKVPTVPEPGAPPESASRPYHVLTADFVTVTEGTGLVHLAPAYGADDLAACAAAGLPVVNPVRPDGRFYDSIRLVGGQRCGDTDKTLVDYLDQRRLLFHSEPHEHSHPHCWRCHTPLLHYASPSWFITTTAVKERLLAENERTTWHPASVKWGRYGEWLSNNVDWALSRSRYWGTPLPLWTCRHEHVTCVGSLAELGDLADRDLTALDPHRPYVDEISFACPRPGCGERTRRVPEVIDAWYDSGAMPFARWGAPHRARSEFTDSYPARFICEAIDQTRGWFYSLMVVGTLTMGRSAYENVLCLGHIVAEDGRRMSTHLGNVLDPRSLMDRHGADALRWFMTVGGSPWSARRVGHAVLEEIVRKVLLTYWNTASFLTLYANAGSNAWTPDRRADAPAPEHRLLLDRWVLAELQATVRTVDDALEDFDTGRAGRRLADFVDDLSNWYVRRSRRRFWDGPGTPSGAAAFTTLYECLETLTRLMAPFTPFITDHVWDAIRPAGAPDSVHLTTWPRVDAALVDERLTARMRFARRLVELGRAARAAAKVRTRQPLGRALVAAAGWHDLPAELRLEIADELNVARVDEVAVDDDGLIDYQVKPNFRELGRRFGARTPKVAEAIAATGPAELVSSLRAAGRATCAVAGIGQVVLWPDDLIVTERPRTGWAVESAAGETVALDLTLTDELRRAGRIRELIRTVQDARKAEGLQVNDRIELWWHTEDAELAAALREDRAEVAAEVLASEVHEAPPPMAPSPHRHEASELSLTFWLRQFD